MADSLRLSPQLSSKARGLLRTLCSSDSVIESSALVTTDGHVVAYEGKVAADEDRLGAISASLLALSARASEECARGGLQQVILHGAQGFMVLTRSGDHGVLMVSTTNMAQLGKIIRDARATATSLGPLLG